ncbi:hypothetical protein FRC07_015150 [Ceratobasidium sp. 392]|nr:hypothetical protein FRC07_015150 [Ceratobasidium sp. 392]
MSDGKTPRIAGRVQRELALSGTPDPFFDKLCEEFYTKFPYRDPKRHPGLTFTPQQQQLAMNKEEKSKLRTRIIDKLGKKRRQTDKRTRRTSVSSVIDLESSDEDEPASIAPKSVHEQARPVEVLKQDLKPLSDIPKRQSVDLDIVPLLNRLDLSYYESDIDKQGLNDIIDRLKDMGPASWAQADEKELRRRQSQLPSILNRILGILGQATGAEIHLDALWHDGGQDLNAYSTSTERSSTFTDSEQARQGRSGFFAFVKEQLVWQGGSLPVPWERLEEDGLTQRFFLVEKSRLPTGVECLRNPDKWNQNETNLWTTALRNPDIPLGSRFQFLQPRPGMVERGTRMLMHPDSRLVYPPESLLYMRRLAAEKAAYESKWEGLPFAPKNLYKPLTEKQLAEAKAAAIGHKQLADLLNYLSDYETYGPYQATRSDWAKAAKACNYLKPEAPSLTAGMEHIVRSLDGNGLQLRWLSFSSAGHKQDLDACLNLVKSHIFCHSRTGTYMAGPYGFKWIVLLLVHLHACGVKTQARPGHVDNSVYAEVKLAIEHVQDVLEMSVKKLYEMSEERSQELASLGEARVGLNEWTGFNIIEHPINTQVDEWTKRTFIATEGVEQYQGRPKTLESSRSSRKHALIDDDDDDIPCEQLVVAPVNVVEKTSKSTAGDTASQAFKQSPMKKLKPILFTADEESAAGPRLSQQREQVYGLAITNE